MALVFAGISVTGCASNCPAPPPAAAASPATPAPLAVPVVASDPKTTTTSDEVATGTTLTKFQRERLLGHYSTHDGTSGFILDRTNGTWKAKLDGTNQVQALTMSHGPYETKEYRSDDHSIWLRVDEHGSVVLFQGPGLHEGVPVIRDADANQL